MSEESKKSSTKKKDTGYKKYSKTSSQAWIDPSSRLKPSDLAKSAVDVVADDYPMIVEFNNIKDNTFHSHSIVDIDEPLFQPSPKVVIFEDYAPFAVHEKKVFFRNNDAVARRMKIIQPDSPFFEISSAKLSNGEPLRQSKLASGMEIYYTIKFKPQEVRDYSLDMICATEREKFIVPIRAIGMRPRLTFPDEIHFGSCPIKTGTRKAILVQNIGASTAEFTMKSLNSNFTCSDEVQCVEPGGSQMIELFFSPSSGNMVTGDLEIVINKGVKCYISMTGSGSNVDVSLSTPSVNLEPSYISLISTKSLRIKNLSNNPIKYTWKSFSCEEEEEAERNRLLMEINRMEDIELSMLQQRVNDGLYIDENHDTDDDEEEKVMIPFSARAEEAALVRKYRNLRVALKNDPMQFVDDIFDITPVEGQVWANSEMEINVKFRPDTAAMFNCLAFLDISGRYDRLSLHLSGVGIGPQAALSFDVLDVGDLFVNNQQQYELTLLNKGDIPAQWNFMSSLTKFGNKFDFSPKEGYLTPGQAQKITILFESDILGEFSEYFRFALQGNEVMLVCQIKGHVIGPTFHFDCNSIDFGTVSFDYLHTTTLRIVNTSKINMIYNLHIPQDGSFMRKEFDIQPSKGTLCPGESHDVVVDFIPFTVKTYDYSLAVDVLGVGDMLLSIPIKADCIVSSVKIETKEIEFGDCFIRFPYEKTFAITNNSNTVYTKFEFIAQPSYTTGTATYEVEPPSAVIEPGQTFVVKVRVIPVKLGSFKLPLQICIAGSQEPPIQSSLSFNSIGPIVKADTTELKWGNVECLKDSVRTLILTNDSLITASLKLFLKMARSKFELNFRELVLKPKESFELQVTANLDDTIVCKDEIHIIVEEGENLMVPINAKGIGTTMMCQSELSVLDLGIQLTNTVFEKRIILENQGRRPQQLKWINKTEADENKIRADKAKSLGKDPNQKLPRHLAPVEPIFTVTPSEIVLRPRTAITFIFKGSNPDIGSFSEVFGLESRVGKERMMKQIVETTVKVDVVNPLLEFSVPGMSFNYTWERGVEAVIQKRPLALTNSSAIPLTFVMKTDVPFNLSSWEYTLGPGEVANVTVEFDPLYTDDKTSHTVEKALTVTYKGHPQKDSIPFTAEVNFPNLKFESTNIQFGCVLNDTSKTMKVNCKNWSKVQVSYSWIFIEQQKQQKGRNSVVSLPLNQCFDILPVRSVLQPGESEDIEVTLIGSANNKIAGNMLCVVEGGPEYKFNISGETSTVSYAIDKSIIDFGKVNFTEKCEQELTITNSGRVNINYSIFPETSNGLDILEIVPMNGKVNAGSSAKVIVRVRLGSPTNICENILVNVAHFEPVKIPCFCQGIFPNAIIFLPRYRKIGPFNEPDGALKEMWDKFQNEVLSAINLPDTSKLPPSLDNIPLPASGSSAIPPVYKDAFTYEEDGDEVFEHRSIDSTQSFKPPPQAVMEVEMHRQVLCKLIANKFEEIKAAEAAAGTVVDPAAPRVGLQETLAKHLTVESLTVAHYMVDFGNVVCGQTKKKSFKIMNASIMGQLNWSFDKTVISGSGFSIEPEKVTKLPEQSSVDFVLKYFARTNLKLGKKTVILPMLVKGAPAVNIVLTANICLPDFELSSEEIDFEKVQIGRSKKMFIRFHNTSPVTAKWLMRRIPGKDEAKITVSPMDGSVRSGKKVVIEIEFIPTEARKYCMELQLRIDMNNKHKIITILGEGTNASVKFDPPNVELGPLFPFSAPEEKIVTAYNLTSNPVEIFSLDFDTVYKEEENILTKLGHIFDQDGLYRAQIRVPGAGLPQEIMQLYEAKLAADAKASLPIDDTPIADATSVEVATEKSGAAELFEPPLRSEPAPRDTNLHQDIVLTGPPVSGVSKVANTLAKKLQLPVYTIDSLLKDIISSKCEEGSTARRLFNQLSPEESAGIKAREVELKAIADASIQPAIDAWKGMPANKKAKEVPPEVSRTQAVLEYEAFIVPPAITVEKIAELLAFRMKWQDVSYGMILDGVSSSLIDSIACEVLQKALPNLIVANLLFPDGREGYSIRLGNLLDTKVDFLHTLQKSFEANKKLFATRNAKAPSRAATANNATMNATMIRESVEDDPDVVISVPTGDEPWVNQETCQVIELDNQDFKVLEENYKNPYLRQLIYQQYLEIKDTHSVIDRINLIWDRDAGLLTERRLPSVESAASTVEGEAVTEDVSPPAAAAAAAAAAKKSYDTLLYSEYEEKVLNTITKFFVPPQLTPVPQTPAPNADELAGVEVEVKEPQMVMQDFGLFNISITEEESPDDLFASVNALIPAAKVQLPDKDALPPSSTSEVVRKPLGRSDRKPIRNFKIVPLNPEDADLTSKGYRWVIEPNSSVQFKIQFQSIDECKSESSMAFEVLGTGQLFSLYCSGICEVPKINNDSRNVFLKRSRALIAGSPPPLKRFVIAENFYCFGPLQIYKKSDWRSIPADTKKEDEQQKYQIIQSTNCDTLRISNSGRYKCTVNFYMEDLVEEFKDIFFVEPAQIEIDEGETKDIKIWAFPREVKEYSNNLIVCVSNNPNSISYPLKVWGVEPTIDVSGPWAEGLVAAEKAVADCKDPKLVKDFEAKVATLKEALTIDFDRILIGKQESRSFDIKNTSSLPMAWELDLGDFKDSSNLSIVPSSGVIPPNTSVGIVLSFTSPTPLLINGKFSLRYSDAEGGLKSKDRVGTKVFRAIAEAYQIVAVSLTSEGQEEGGNIVDFGTMRVGDYAIKTLKIGNKGKYKIGYKLSIMKHLLQDIVKIEPSEGTIEAGPNTSEVKLTFCSPKGELALVNNKDILVEILEPLTGEHVEKFTLSLSANAKYNKFRMQPAKGMQFGAVRFDSDVRTKRVELRNEGIFPFTYVICSSQSEFDEIESLDAAAFQAYAFGCPNGLRSGELGENYMKKCKTGGGGGGKAAAPAAPAKGAPAKGAAPALAAPKSAGNPLVKDLDDLAEGPLPTDALVIGPFNISPRIGVVEPGQCVGIDMKYDPRGCVPSRERLRFAIGGVNPNDSFTKIIRSFDVTGESCLPAIVTNEPYSIFEEQEVCNSLADSLGTNTAEGSAKFEKLPVGKVIYSISEKLLAFGPIMCNSSNNKGAVERIRIVNPTKVDTKVKFRILDPNAAAKYLEDLAAGKKPSGGGAAAAPSAKGGKGGAPEPAASGATAAPVGSISCQPESWEIPPHESRFVNIFFNPTEIMSYKSVFIAEVDFDGTQSSAKSQDPNSGNVLSFNVVGSGTLPCIAIDQPTDRTASGACAIEFGKLHINRSIKKKIVLRNDGAMPSTCLFDMSGQADFFNFAAKGTSLTIQPGCTETLYVSFSPKTISDKCSAVISLSVLANPYDQYRIELSGNSYACDAMIESISEDSNIEDENGETNSKNHEQIQFNAVNLTEGPGSSTHTFLLKSRSGHPLKFSVALPAEHASTIECSPKEGHLGANMSKELTLTFKADKQCKLENIPATITLKRIEYVMDEKVGDNTQLWGKWDSSMVSMRPVTAEDLAAIQAAEDALKKYNDDCAAEAAKGKKGKAPGPPPNPCNIKLSPGSDGGSQMVFEVVLEPKHNLVTGTPDQNLLLNCFASADFAKYKCDHFGDAINLKPTFLFQSTVHKFNFTNESNIAIPVKWFFENIKRKNSTRQSSQQGTRQGSRGANSQAQIPCPFSIEPAETTVAPKSSTQFKLSFLPIDTDDFVYLLRGETIPATPVTEKPAEGEGAHPFHIAVRGTSKRPLCHFDVVEAPDYLNRRPPNLKNENGIQSPIECNNLRVAEVESIGLKTRNTFRFHVTNPTQDNYEFLWEALGDPSPFWRCVQSAGMLFAGKRVEMVFEYLPEEIGVAEAFFRFKLPSSGIEQIFLFTGKIKEPRVHFSTSKIDFHSVMLGGEGGGDTIYLENEEHLPFNFAFDRSSLLQLEGPHGDTLEISPKSGMVPPHSKIPIQFLFRPQEEVLYNFNLSCDVKRKPNKLSINVKGEGYSVHPLIQIEQSEEQRKLMGPLSTRFQSIKPSPSVNYSDFGVVQVLDVVSKVITVSNHGKYNFDYVWNIDQLGSMIHLAGGKLGGTLHKGEEISYTLSYSPQKAESLEGASLSLTVAGKYTYNIFCRGVAVEPALRFSFMTHDFGPCFITSPGGTTVVEETILRLVNHDPTNNISIECAFQKTRALWLDCPPTVIEPGGLLEIPVHFAPRDAIDYAFVVPFVINGTSKVLVHLTGRGIHARLELANQSQHRVNFGLVNVGSDLNKTITIVNRSKKALPVQLVEEGKFGGLEERCISYSPRSEFIINPRESANILIAFTPGKRISQFSEDLLVRYAGVTRKLLSISGKAQGSEVSLDTDSLPFGVVVIDSQKTKQLTLENTGDLPITFNWMESSFGKHFSIKPVSGKVLAGNEIAFDVTFKPQFTDEDIRQDNIFLSIPGVPPLSLTCTGSCISQPTENIQEISFNSLARKAEVKNVKISNPSDKDWYLSPSLQGVHWKIPYEFKVPAKGSADLSVTYFPLSMCNNGPKPEETHQGQMFIACPDGSALLYKLKGVAGKPESNGTVSIETTAKKPASMNVKLNNWLNETQKFKVAVEILESPSPATSIIAANAVEVVPNGIKEFPIRFVSMTEGITKGKITFTNIATGEYAYYDIVAKATMAEILETITLDSPVRVTARYIISLDNPLPATTTVTMTSGKPNEWWTCDSPYVKVNELLPFTGHSEGSFEIEYRPLMPTTQPLEHLLSIYSKELGVFKYKLIVTATPPSIRQTLRFEVPLGSMQTEAFTFKSYNKVKTEYSSKIEKPDIFGVSAKIPVEPVAAWEGANVKVDISFEPIAIGTVSDTLVIKSAEGGEYICDLVASCIAPMPLGPFNLSQGGGNVDVPFRNPFPQPYNFQFSVDSPAFKLGTAAANIPKKSEGKVSVTFVPEVGTTHPSGFITGKLFVTCKEMPTLSPWIFYLRGKLADPATLAAAQAAPAGKKK